MSVAARWSAIAGLSAMLALGGICIPATPALAQSGRTVMSNVRISLEDIGPVAGPGGKSFTADGALHVVFNVQRDRAGGIHVQGHANGQGIKLSEINGEDIYRLNGAANLTANTKAAKEGATTFTVVANFGLIGQGSLANQRLHLNIHGTINDSNEVTAAVASIRFSEK